MWEIGQSLTLLVFSINCVTVLIKKVNLKKHYTFIKLIIVVGELINVFIQFCNSPNEYVTAPCCIPALIAGTRNLPTRLFSGISSRE